MKVRSGTSSYNGLSWDLVQPDQPPVTWPAPEHQAAGVQGLFLENIPWKGKPTRVFAWLGMPYLPPGASCPAIILLLGSTRRDCRSD